LDSGISKADPSEELLSQDVMLPQSKLTSKK
jgi:hypothetical protein